MKLYKTILLLLLLSTQLLISSVVIDLSPLERSILEGSREVNYSIFDIDLSGKGYLTDEFNRNYQLNLKPNYLYYYDDYEEIRELTTKLDLDYNFQRIYSDYLDKSSSRNRVDIDFSFNYLNRYFLTKKDLFFSSEIGNSSNFSNSSNSDETFDSRLLFESTTIAGKGRVKDISSNIRVLKFIDRLNEVDQNGLIYNETTIDSITKIIDRYDEYRRKYDRPLKRVWSQLEKVLGDRAKKLDPFDIVYISEFIEKGIRVRKDGTQYGGGLIFDWLTTDYSKTTSIFEEDYYRYGAIIEAQHYETISIDQEYHISGGLEISNKKFDEYDLLLIDLYIEQGYLIDIWDNYTDMLSLKASFNYYDSDSKISENRKGHTIPVVLTNSFNYFIEDKITLYFDQTFEYQHLYAPGLNSDDDMDSADLGFEFGIKYRF